MCDLDFQYPQPGGRTQAEVSEVDDVVAYIATLE